MAIRSPIVVLLGHVDHGKTTLLDKIRGTAVAKAEPGLITQSIGATNILIQTIKKLCGGLLDQFKIALTIPGLLFIDTPGHEAFTTLRKRGGAIADLAILVIDVNEGFQPQTDESLRFLKQFKTPFVVAATKIDRVAGWNPNPDSPFLASFKEQTQRVQDEVEEKIYKLIGQLSSRGFEAERYDRVTDFAKQISIVPVSGMTGEGLPDLLTVLAGIAQRFLKDRLGVTPGEGRGTVLEVKEFKGLGTTIDVILYDGEIRRGDWIVIGGKEILTTRVKAILEPAAMKELRVENAFAPVELVTAATGLKIAAPNLDKVIAGSPLRAVRMKKALEKVIKEVEQEIEEVEIVTERVGAILKADTLGSLEALIKVLAELKIPIRKAVIGDVSRADIMEIKSLENPMIFAFGVRATQDILKLAKDNQVKIFSSDVIYKLIDDYQKWEQERKKEAESKLLEQVIRPAKIKALPGFVFRQSKPAVFGVEILKGTIKPGYKLKKGKKVIGAIKEIQLRGGTVKEAKIGDKVAVSMPDVTVGKQVKEGDILDVFLTEKSIEKLEKIRAKLRPDEIELLEEM